MLVQARLAPRAAIALFVGAALAMFAASSAFAAEKEPLVVYVPCGMELPFMAAAEVFNTDHPDAAIGVELDNADILVQRVLDKGEKPDIIVSPGAVEMKTMIDSGKVAAGDVSHFGRYELVLFTPRANPAQVKTIEDIVKPEVKAIALPNPKQNSVGRYTRQMLEKKGLWAKVERKLVSSDHPIDAYKLVARGQAQASFAYRSCPLQSAPDKLEYSKVAIIESVPMDLYDPAYATIGILKASPHRALAKSFVAFLLSEKGQKILADNGVPSMTNLRVFVPCGMISSLMAIQQKYQSAAPMVELTYDFDRIDALIDKILKGGARPDVQLATGPIEMDALVKAGRVAKGDVAPIGRFRLALCVNIAHKDDIRAMADLARADVKTIAVPKPETSSLGAQVVTAMKTLGLWDKVKDKITWLPATKDCYAAVAGGRADAGFGYLGCPIVIDPAKMAYSKVRAAEVLDPKLYGDAVALAAVLKDSRHAAEAKAFVAYLISPAGRTFLARAGIEPLTAEKKKEER